MNPALTDPAAAKELTNEQWVALHVPRLARIVPAYVEYETFLNEALKQMTRRVAPLAVVEARAKGLPSFAEKILRKRDTYQTPGGPQPPDPLVRITDLCGGRVICQTAAQVRTVCDWIERAFIIDWANSEDVSQRLKPTEFGYRSVHYIVQVDPPRLAAAGLKLDVPPVLLGLPAAEVGEQAAGIPLKAEIQVRTLLEHASSMLGHDTIYKTELKVPQRIQRQYAALAAVLEGADHETERLLDALGGFESNSGAWLDRETLKSEIAHANVMLGLDDAHLPLAAKIPTAVRAANLAQAIGDHKQAITILQPFQGQAAPCVLRTLGQAMVELHWNAPQGADFAAGRDFLREATRLAPADAETLCLRAECEAHCDDDEEARSLFAQAVAADATEPLTLARYLEFEVAAHQGGDTPLRLAAPMIRAAMDRAHRQIEARANLSTAWSAMALFHLFQHEPFDAIDALAQVARLCQGGETTDTPEHHCAASRQLLRLRESTRRLKGIREKLDGFDWFERFVLLALKVKCDDSRAAVALSALASWRLPAATDGKSHFNPERKTVFLAGACKAALQPIIQPLGLLLERACRDLEFDLIGGGTPAGVSGLGGELAQRSIGRIHAFGYLPAALPRGEKEDSVGYPLRFSTPGTTDFSPMDPLQAWTDLVAAGVSPSDVKLLCYAPGDISRAECAITLALGARVGVIVDPTLPSDRGFDSAPWEGCDNLLLLPKDAMTLRTFLQIDSQPLGASDKARLEPAARLAHEDYVRSATPKDPSLQSWENLSDDLKDSNYHQVAYWEHALREFGLGIRPLTAADKLLDPPRIEDILPKHGDKDPLVELAELEHGRWNVERLGFGWQYAPEKDVSRKLSPWLIPWDELPPDIQQYDINAITGLPSKLREDGREIYRLENSATLP